MNDVERLAQALRQANAALDVDPVELTDVVADARRRMTRRLLFVATLSALVTALLLSSGLAASDVVKEHRESSQKNDNSKTNSHGKGNGGNGQGGNHGGGNGGHRGHHGGQDNGGGGEGGKKERDRSEKDKGGGTEAPSEELPDLVVLSVTETEVVIEDRSDFAAEPFFVLVTVPGTEFEESLFFENGIAGHESIPKLLQVKPECPAGDEIIALVDASEAVTELDEDHNTDSAPCESEAGTTTSKDEAAANAVTEETTATGK